MTPPIANRSTGEVVEADFAAFLEEHRPETVVELGEALQKLVTRVMETHKRGSITFTLKVGPTDGSVRPLTIVDQIKLTLPEHDREPSFAFADKDGNLTARDPDALFVVT